MFRGFGTKPSLFTCSLVQLPNNTSIVDCCHVGLPQRVQVKKPNLDLRLLGGWKTTKNVLPIFTLNNQGLFFPLLKGKTTQEKPTVSSSWYMNSFTTRPFGVWTTPIPLPPPSDAMHGFRVKYFLLRLNQDMAPLIRGNKTQTFLRVQHN